MEELEEKAKNPAGGVEQKENFEIRILVADDNTQIRKAFRTVANMYGWVLTIEEDGESLLKTLNNKKGEFDFIITDFRMPRGITGLEIAKQIKNNPELKNLPVMVFTSDDIKKEVEDTGAIYYKKDLSRSWGELSEKIKDVLSRNKS